MLRVADGLDRTNRQLIRSVRCRMLSRDVELVLTPASPLAGADPDVELELWSARRKADLLEEVFRRKVRLLIAPASQPQSTKTRRSSGRLPGSPG